MSNLANRVKETTLTQGTGTYDLEGAASTFQTFLAGLQAQGKASPVSSVPYMVVQSDANGNNTDVEIGKGTITDGGAGKDTLSRDSVVFSTNGNAAVDWGAGTKVVVLSPLASDFSSHGFKSVQVFTNSGTWTKPEGITKVLVECQGGGGSGGSGESHPWSGGCGGAGGYGKKVLDVSSIASVTVTIGTGGAPAAAGGNDGNTGNSSSFGSYLSCTGGGPGLKHSNGGDGGAGGTSSGGDWNVTGQKGTTSGGETPGFGGSTPIAIGGPSASVTGVAGYDGQYGGGGGSAIGTSAASGAGGDGLVIVWEFQ